MVPENEEQPVVDDRPTLTELREDAGYSQRELGLLIGVDATTISRIERAYDPAQLPRLVKTYGTPKESTYAVIAHAFNMRTCGIRWPCDGSVRSGGSEAGDKHSSCATSVTDRQCKSCFIVLPKSASPETVYCDDCA